MKSTIPTPLMELLRNRWQPTQQGHSFFETAWSKDHLGGPDRQHRPSWYIYRKGDEGRDSMQMLKYAEVERLASDPAFAGLIISRSAGHYAVNEHLEHAISDFCNAVYDAFDVMESRLALISQKQIDPDTD